MNTQKLNTLRERAKCSLRKDAPLTRGELRETLNIGHNDLIRVIKSLINTGDVFVVRGVGYFVDEPQYDSWNSKYVSRGTSTIMKKHASKNHEILFINSGEKSGWNPKKGFKPTFTIGNPARFKQ